MIITSHIVGRFKATAYYMKKQADNDRIRVVDLNDPDVRTIDEAFDSMWIIASGTRCSKPLHHVSINPMYGEQLDDKKLLDIVTKCEQKFGYKRFHHQRVIVEHIKNGRQHFHVIWNRVSLITGVAISPGLDWKKSVQLAREIEEEFGLKRSAWTRTRNYNPRGQCSAGSKRARKSYWSSREYVEKSKDITANPRVADKPPIKSQKDEPLNLPFRTAAKGWPENAVIDWEAWGHQFPKRFFIKWPELSCQ